MIVLYNVLIYWVSKLFWVAAFINPKARLFVEGRKGLTRKIAASLKDNTAPVIWIHCASLGEFEQGRPIMEALKREKPQHKILLTFFSPSGYEVRKGYEYADWVFYLPWDTKGRASRFVTSVKPVLAIFVKYEFWFNYSAELKKRSIPTLSIASIFRSEQLFFKTYGGFYRSILKNFSYFFVQNFSSQELLKSIGITVASVAGDTRFDRVFEIVNKSERIPIAAAFKGNEKTFIIGSAWPEDMDVLSPFINGNGKHIKFIIAPHEVSETTLSSIEKQLRQPCIRYSQADGKDLSQYSVLLIDNVGMLSRLYRYGEFAFIGGAYGKGLHNILEAACFGIPVFFGNKNFEKFQEAKDLINRGGAFEVADYSDFLIKYENITIPENFMLACEVTKSYVQENLGATEKIMSYCRNVLKA